MIFVLNSGEEAEVDLPLRRSKTMIGFHCLMVVAILVVEANLAERKIVAFKIRQLDWTVFFCYYIPASRVAWELLEGVEQTY